MEIEGQKVDQNANIIDNQPQKKEEPKVEQPEIELNLQDIAQIPTQLKGITETLNTLKEDIKANREALQNYKPRLKIVNNAPPKKPLKDEVKDFFNSYV